MSIRVSARRRLARRHAPRSAFSLILLTFCGCAYAIVRSATVNLSKAERVEEGLQNLRGLSFKSAVPIEVMTPEEAEQVIVEQIQRDYTDEHLKVESQVGALVGLYPAGFDLKAESLKLLKSQVAGFYEPHRKEMILVSGMTDMGFWNRAAQFLIQRDVVGESLLAHELTHALQDQHFGVNDKLEKLKDNDDQALALKSVAEGDATLAGLGYVVGKTDRATVDLLIAKLDELPAQFAAQSNGAPEALSVPLVFQYSAGARFVAASLRRGGWKAVNDLYRSPPQSSQQIMHPALYFDRPTPPAEIAVAGYESALAGWHKVDDNTIGELLLKVIFRRNLGSGVETALADRWAGDRMVVLRKGDALTVLWILLFNDDNSAARFAALYGDALTRILGAATPHRTDYKSDAVLVVIGEDATRMSDLAPAIWKGSRIRRQTPGRPPATRATAAGTCAVASAGSPEIR